MDSPTREQVYEAIHEVVASTVVSDAAADAVMDLVADVELDIEGVLRERIDLLRAEVARVTTESGPQPKVPQPEMVWTGDAGDLCSVDGANPVGGEPGTKVAVVVIRDTERSDA